MAEVKLEDIKPNSFKSKEMADPKAKTPDKVKPVVDKSAVVSTKKSLGQKFKDAFIKEDINDVKSWLIEDVVIPGVKNTILDMLSRVFFNKNSSGRGYGGYYNSSYNYGGASYGSYYQSQQRPSGPPHQGNRGYVSPNAKVDYRDIVLARRDDAERVVGEMQRRIADLGQVSIAEMLDFMEITSSYTDNNWGWKRVNDIGVRRVSNGWLIDVNEVVPLEG